MTLPLFSLLLAIAGLLLALTLLAALPRAQADAAVTTRLSEAVSRALLGQLGTAVLPAAGAFGAVLVASLLLARAADAHFARFVIAPLLGLTAALAAGYQAGRQGSRTGARLVGLRGRDALLTLVARGAGSSMLVAAALGFAVTLGIPLLWGAHVPEEELRLLVLSAAAGGIVPLSVLDRSVVLSAHAAEALHVDAGTLHRTTLARLVGASGGAGFVHASTAFGVSAFGEAALLYPQGSDAALGHALGFAKLLGPLGVLAAFFGLAALRSTESESPRTAWRRSIFVGLGVLVSGVWALVGLLPGSVETTPLAVFVTALAVVALGAPLLSGALPSPEGRAPEARGPEARGDRTSGWSAPNGWPLLVLVSIPIALTAAVLSEEAPRIAPDGLLPLVLATFLSVFPLGQALVLSARCLDAKESTELLAREGAPDQQGGLATGHLGLAASHRLVLVFGVGVVLVLGSAMEMAGSGLGGPGGLGAAGGLSGSSGLLVALGTGFSLVVWRALSLVLTQGADAHVRAIDAGHSAEVESQAPQLGPALDALERASRAGAIEHALWLLVPGVMVALLVALSPRLSPLSSGFAFGLALLGTALSTSLVERKPTKSTLVLPTGLALLIWILLLDSTLGSAASTLS